MSNKAINEAWAWLKTFGTQQQKELFRPVYLYIQSLEKRIKELEKIHDKHMAPQMFQPPPTNKEILIQQQIEKRRLESKQALKFSPLKERLLDMVNGNAIGSKQWNQTLKWNRLTEEKALQIVNEFIESKKQNGTKNTPTNHP